MGQRTAKNGQRHFQQLFTPVHFCERVTPAEELTRVSVFISVGVRCKLPVGTLKSVVTWCHLLDLGSNFLLIWDAWNSKRKPTCSKMLNAELMSPESLPYLRGSTYKTSPLELDSVLSRSLHVSIRCHRWVPRPPTCWFQHAPTTCIMTACAISKHVLK